MHQIVAGTADAQVQCGAQVYMYAGKCKVLQQTLATLRTWKKAVKQSKQVAKHCAPAGWPCQRLPQLGQQQHGLLAYTAAQHRQQRPLPCPAPLGSAQ